MRVVFISTLHVSWWCNLLSLCIFKLLVVNFVLKLFHSLKYCMQPVNISFKLSIHKQITCRDYKRQGNTSSRCKRILLKYTIIVYTQQNIQASPPSVSLRGSTIHIHSSTISEPVRVEHGNGHLNQTRPASLTLAVNIVINRLQNETNEKLLVSFLCYGQVDGACCGSQ